MTKTKTFDDADDTNRCLFLKGSKQVFVGFTY